MAQRWEQVVVVGAGIGGLLFARVLADWCARVVVLERDSLLQDAEPRSGVPQGRHLHGLLAGGCRAMEAMLPGLMGDLRAAGAVEGVAGWSQRLETPGHDPFPRRDLGITLYSASRPLLELCVRRRVQAISNIAITDEAHVAAVLHDAQAVTGVRLRDGRTVPADLVIDATGRGELTQRALESLGLALPQQTKIGVDMRYVTALFKIPPAANYEWKSVLTAPRAPRESKAALMATIEGGRWICALGWRGAEVAPLDRDTFVEWARGLRTQTVYHAIKDAEMLGKVMRYAFNDSCHRHYARLESWPRGLLPVADAICCFNPIYGQGMSVAALQAEVLGQLLAAAPATSMDELARQFFTRCDEIIEGPWNMAALPDFAYPDTRGERPPDLQHWMRFNQAFTELAARDADVHKLLQEIRGLIKPRSALTGNPALLQRIQAVMVELQQAKAATAAN